MGKVSTDFFWRSGDFERLIIQKTARPVGLRAAVAAAVPGQAAELSPPFCAAYQVCGFDRMRHHGSTSSRNRVKPERAGNHGYFRIAALQMVANRLTRGQDGFTNKLIRNENGQPLSYHALWNRFEEARKRTADALAAAGSSEGAVAVRGFQFRYLRAKAGTDKADSTDLLGAQRHLGHRSVKTTEIYLRSRAGDKVTPTK